jgi:hypothetical protein
MFRTPSGIVSRRIPRAENTAQRNQFSDVPGIVIGELERLAQQRLALAVGERRIQIGGRIGHQFPHGLQIVTERLHAVVPGGLIRRGRAGRPVAFGPFRRKMLGVAAEFQHVPLGDAQMFEHFPDAVRRVMSLHAMQAGG